MKAKISKKEIKNRFNTILEVNEDNIYNLLYFSSPFAYSTRLEGWACDYYEIGNFCLCSGYDPIGKKSNRKLENNFEIKAKKIVQSKFLKTATKQKKIKDLLLKFSIELNNN